MSLKLVGFALAGQPALWVASLLRMGGQHLREGGLQRVVAAGGLVVGAKQDLGARFPGVLDARVERAVAPALLGGVLLLRVRTVGNEHVNALHGPADTGGLLVYKGLVKGVVFITRPINVDRWLMVSGKKD